MPSPLRKDDCAPAVSPPAPLDLRPVEGPPADEELAVVGKARLPRRAQCLRSFQRSFPPVLAPDLAARCHANEELMSKYGISTNVFNSYVSDFHGTTVIFDQNYPDQDFNKPVCIDCHGVHNMKMVDTAESQVMKENLLNTCQQCHPSATANFTDAWLSHYEPDPQHYPLVYYVNLFYKIFIPGVLGFMAIFVIGDAGRRLIIRRREKRQ